MSLFGRNVALIAIFGIALVILFPASFGPFQVTHGPASSLRAIAYADLIFFCLSCLIVILTCNPAWRIRESHPATTDSLAGPHISRTLRC
jgi:hypothetical protein